MNISLRARTVLAALALSIVGCDPAEPPSEGPPVPEEHSGSKLGGPAPEPPVMPSPVPSLPATSKTDMQPDTKPVEKMEEPKAAAPK